MPVKTYYISCGKNKHLETKKNNVWFKLDNNYEQEQHNNKIKCNIIKKNEEKI